jgi:hypothetical protein
VIEIIVILDPFFSYIVKQFFCHVSTYLTKKKKIENRTELKEKIHEKKNILQQNHEGLAYCT